jgi:GNAT superfamily N-acetyltransferase
VLRADDWIDVVDAHYLGDFLPRGGASVKFAVCLDDGETHVVARKIAERAERRGFVTATVSAETVRIQLIEKLFGAIADQVPWNEITTNVLCGFARDHHWQVPERIDPERGLVEQLNECNHLGVEQISLVLQQDCGRRILGDHSLAKDFRVAMTWLARGRLKSGLSGDAAHQQITDWLGGRVAAIRNLRNYQIYTKISRANARHLFGSLCAWLRAAGSPGLVTTIDASRILSKVRSEVRSQNYSIAAVLDAYEVFRQFIDATDDFEGFLLTVIVPREFLELDARGRGIARYPALMGRVYDEVRDRNVANPYGALIRLGSQQEAA